MTAIGPIGRKYRSPLEFLVHRSIRQTPLVFSGQFRHCLQWRNANDSQLLAAPTVSKAQPSNRQGASVRQTAAVSARESVAAEWLASAGLQNRCGPRL